jgi:hypothetical protein
VCPGHYGYSPVDVGPVSLYGEVLPLSANGVDATDSHRGAALDLARIFVIRAIVDTHAALSRAQSMNAIDSLG